MGMTSLHSSVEEIAPIVTQITGFRDGSKKTWKGVKTDTIIEGSFCKFDTEDGRRVMVNTQNVNWIEIL